MIDATSHDGASHLPRHSMQVEFLPRMCGQHVADVTIGCTFGCLYCPYAARAAERFRIPAPTRVDVSAISAQPAPESVCLSAASDAFAPQAAQQTHAILENWLSRGTLVTIVTKGVIPLRTLDLLREFRSQVEGVSIGVASLEAHRNRIIEPGAPPASARLVNIDRLAARGIPVVLRMNPIFPIIDDSPNALGEVVAEAARRGSWRIMGAYVFAWGRYLRRLRRVPFLSESCRMLTERAPMEGGGTAFSVPLSRKRETYTRLAELALIHGLEFNACACQDLRLQGTVPYPTSCRNQKFLERMRSLPGRK